MRVAVDVELVNDAWLQRVCLGEGLIAFSGATTRSGSGLAPKSRLRTKEVVKALMGMAVCQSTSKVFEQQHEPAWRRSGRRCRRGSIGQSSRHAFSIETVEGIRSPMSKPAA